MGIEGEFVNHHVRIIGTPQKDIIEENYFFVGNGQRFVFRYDLDDRPKVIQHVCEVSKDIERVKEHYFYEHIFSIMTHYVDLTKLFDNSDQE